MAKPLPLSASARRLALCILCALLPVIAQAEIAAREGWSITQTSKDYKTLLKDLKAAVRAHKMGLVTEAGPTGAAAARGITLPGNRVIGVFRNDFAVAVLAQSTAAMIEAPLRYYITEDSRGTAVLSYKTPSFVFAPYLDEGGVRLKEISNELDQIFAQIAQDATH